MTPRSPLHIYHPAATDSRNPTLSSPVPQMATDFRGELVHVFTYRVRVSNLR